MIAVVDPARARIEARHILSERRYKGAPVPRPLRGVLRWIGDRFSPITHWIGRQFRWIPVPARPWVEVVAVLAVAALVVVVVKTVVDARAQARAARLGEDAWAGGGAPSAADDPAALEAAATDAETRGDLALAVRLRFRAGLVRLDRDAHAITYRPSIPNAEVRAELGSPEFDELADTFEGITYGENAAEPADTIDARREWPRVLHSARRR